MEIGGGKVNTRNILAGSDYIDDKNSVDSASRSAFICSPDSDGDNNSFSASKQGLLEEAFPDMSLEKIKTDL
jgi:hypothetical protein